MIHELTIIYSGIVDSSGIQFTYLETPREHDAGILFIGHEVSSFMVVPPNAANYTVSAFCPMECTNEVKISVVHNQ